MEKDVTILISNEPEAHPAAMLVQTASRYDSSVYLVTPGKKVNAKSIMGMMSLNMQKGDVVKVIVEGADEAEALQGIEAFLSGK